MTGGACANAREFTLNLRAVVWRAHVKHVASHSLGSSPWPVWSMSTVRTTEGATSRV